MSPPLKGQLGKCTKIALVDTVAVKPQCTLSTFQRLPCLLAREGRGQRDCQTPLLVALLNQNRLVDIFLEKQKLGDQ